MNVGVFWNILLLSWFFFDHDFEIEGAKVSLIMEQAPLCPGHPGRVVMCETAGKN